MNEAVFREILAESLRREYSGFDNAPEHKFSLKHRFAMKRLFAKYETNMSKDRKKGINVRSQTSENKPKSSLKQRLIIAVVIVVLMTLLVGWVVIYISGNFRGTVYPDNTQFAVTDLEGSPQTIEYKYALVSVPAGFEMVKTDSSPIHIYTFYMNKSTGQTISFRQWVKSNYQSSYNTENHVLEDVIIDGYSGLCIDLSNDEYNSSLVVWNNGDYIIEILADLPKDDALNLAKIHKVE